MAFCHPLYVMFSLLAVSNRTFSLLMLLFYAIGGGVAFRLGSLQKLEMFKVLNIVGIIYGLVGV